MKKNIIKIVSVIILVIIVVIAILSRKTTKVESPEVETTTKVTTTVAETTVTTTTTPVTTTTITELVTTLEETTITEAITEKLIQETVYIEPKVAVPVTQIEVTIPVVPVTDAPVVTDAPAVTQEIINPPANNTVDYNNMTSLGSLKITGYVATGNKTASGVYPYVGGCAMSRSHGIPFGSTVYVEGLGYYTVNDTGCAYGVVDIFCSTVQECYNLTGNYNVYLVN